MVIGILSAQKGAYYQQFAKYKMDIKYTKEGVRKCS